MAKPSTQGYALTVTAGSGMSASRVYFPAGVSDGAGGWPGDWEKCPSDVGLECAPCLHGTCVAAGGSSSSSSLPTATATCVCDIGFHGPGCGTVTCPGQCSGRGLCITPAAAAAAEAAAADGGSGECKCDSGWSGEGCEIGQCAGMVALTSTAGIITDRCDTGRH